MNSLKYQSVFRNCLFDGKVVIVTGGGSGIGKCIAAELFSLGATVIITGRRVEKLQKTSDQIKSTIKVDAGIIDYHEMNIRSEESVVKAISNILNKYKKIDSLVNNAGGQFASPVAAMSRKGWNAVIDTNLNGTFNVIKSVYDLYMRDNGGNIVTIVAEMFNGFPMMAHTGAARAGVVNLTQTLAIEWASSKIRINCVAPGLILGNGINNYPKNVQESMFTTVAWQSPSGRMGTESEIASAVTFLLSPGASYINGATLRVDGGSSLSNCGREVYFSPDVHFDAYNGLPENINNEMSPSVRALFDKYNKAKL